MLGNTDFSTRPVSDYLLNETFDNNRSFNSILSASSMASNGTSSSKAVLAALRALQDKIRRLESERSLAVDEVNQLKLQIRNQEIEFGHRKQQDELNTQKTLQEARAANEKIMHDKNGLGVKVSIVEEKNVLLQTQIDDFQKKIKLLEDEKQHLSFCLKEYELQQARLEEDIKQSQSKEKGLAQSLLWETKRYEEDIELLQQRIDTLQRDVQSTSQEKNILDIKLIELDQLVGQLVALNGTLVSQLSTSSKKVASSTGSKKLSSKKSTKADSVSSTITRDLSKAAKSVSAAAKRSILIKTSDDVEHLKHMHKMYADLARNITRSLSPEKSKLVSSTKHRKKTSTEINSPSRTRMSTKVSNSQELSRLVDETPIRQDSTMRIPRFTSLKDYDENSGSVFEQNNTTNSSVLPKYSHIPSANSRYSETEKNSKSDLQSMIYSLEDEFDMLNQQYRSLLSSVQASSNVIPSSATPEATAEEIVLLIQKLHEKGEQLRTLKSPSK